VSIDQTNPNPGPVPHSFADLDGGGVCACGLPRMVGCHVAEPDERDQLAAMVAQALASITGEVLAVQTYLARLGVMEADR
jgi:hypothetical protein